MQIRLRLAPQHFYTLQKEFGTSFIMAVFEDFFEKYFIVQSELFVQNCFSHR